jgi:hypothetical protein
MNLPTSLRNVHRWYPGYLAERQRRMAAPVKPRHVWVMLSDHYEPYWGGAGHRLALDRVRDWSCSWPRVSARHTDSDGRHPIYTFFYAQEQYRRDLLEPLAGLVQEGIASFEVHIHHDGEGQTDFMGRMRRFLDQLYLGHGLLREWEGKIAFGFIHGNWALDNSRPDGRFCGLNNELLLLKELGCYADFTLPSAPNATQTATVNTIYWASDDPARPRSHEHGTPLRPGGGIDGDLLMVPGPLGFNFRGGRLLPRLETGEIAAHDPPVAGRASSWIDLAPRISEHAFVKLFAHGTQEANAGVLLGGGLDVCFEDLAAECARRSCELHFVSAWDMRRALECLRLGRNPLSVVRSMCLANRE